MYRTVVVPLDGSALAEQALPAAVAIVRAAEGALHLVRVHPEPAIGELAPLASLSAADERLRQAEEDYLGDVEALIAREVDGGTRGTVHTAVLDGPVAAAIEAYASAQRADLVVMTTHGRTGVSRAWLGSVADALVRQETLPVLMVRATEFGPEMPWEWAPRHVLVPLDGSEAAEAILPHAITLGRIDEARYTLARVVQPPPPLVHPSPLDATPTVIDPAPMEMLVDRAESYLENVELRLRAEYAGIVVRHVACVDPSPAAALLRCARSDEVDLVAMTVRGRGASRLIVGSVADKLLRGTELPMLVLRPR